MKKMIQILAMLFVLIALVGCSGIPNTTREDIGLNSSVASAKIGKHCAYIPISYDLPNTTSNNESFIGIVIQILDKFEKKNDVQVIAWTYDKKNETNRILGLCVTFIRPMPTKIEKGNPRPDL